MNEGIYFWIRDYDGESNISSPLDFEEAPDSWRKELARLSPWERTECPDRSLRSIWFKSQKKGVRSPLIITGKCSSTMELSFELSERGLFPLWASLIAMSQSEGRGRSGRKWWSPFGNLYASVRIPNVKERIATLQGIFAAYAVASSIESLLLEVRIKWPNDILIGDAKVGGILIEQKGDIIIAGIGINIELSPEQEFLRREKGSKATCLKEFGIDIAPLSLWLTIINDFPLIFENMIDSERIEMTLRAVEEKLAYAGREVIFENIEGSSFRAKLLGIHPSGGLILGTKEGEVVESSGHIYPVYSG